MACATKEMAVTGVTISTLSGSAAERYQRNMVPAIFLPFAEDLLGYAALEDGEHVLDVACGTGIVSLLAWPAVASSGSVVGLDINPNMLKVAREIAHQQGAAIEWKEGEAGDMAFADGQFDAILCQHGIQYFPDRPAALAEMRRVLKDDGRLIANLWRAIEFNPGHLVFAEVLERHVSQEAGATRRAPFKLSQREEIRRLFSDAGFANVTIHLSTRVTRFPSAEAMVRIMMAGTPLGGAMADADPGLVTRVIDEVTSGLENFVDDDGLAIPMQAWVILARK
jgi:ubiquinone/menaquinone biosynthesis C-methylase UbiE